MCTSTESTRVPLGCNSCSPAVVSYQRRAAARAGPASSQRSGVGVSAASVTIQPTTRLNSLPISAGGAAGGASAATPSATDDTASATVGSPTIRPAISARARLCGSSRSSGVPAASSTRLARV